MLCVIPEYLANFLFLTQCCITLVAAIESSWEQERTEDGLKAKLVLATPGISRPVPLKKWRSKSR